VIFLRQVTALQIQACRDQMPVRKKQKSKFVTFVFKTFKKAYLSRL